MSEGENSAPAPEAPVTDTSEPIAGGALAQEPAYAGNDTAMTAGEAEEIELYEAESAEVSEAEGDPYAEAALDEEGGDNPFVQELETEESLPEGGAPQAGSVATQTIPNPQLVSEEVDEQQTESEEASEISSASEQEFEQSMGQAESFDEEMNSETLSGG